MRSYNGTFSRQMPPGLVFAFRLLQAPISGNVSGCSSSCVCRLLDAILLPLEAGTGTDAIFTSGVHSPLEEERRSIAVSFFPLPQTNENRLNHGQNLKIINLRDQASHESGNVPFKKKP